MNKNKLRNTIIIWACFFAALVWFGFKLGMVYYVGIGIEAFSDALAETLKHPFTLAMGAHTGAFCMLMLMGGAAALGTYLVYYGKYREGEEMGSADWATPAQVNAVVEQAENIVASEGVRYGIDMYGHQMNTNMFICGGPGSNKTWGEVIPNVLEFNSNMVITDSKGDILRNTGHALEQAGYSIKVFNIKDLKYGRTDHSNGYNPFRYLRTDTDVQLMAESIVKNTTSDESIKSQDSDYWKNNEVLVLEAGIFYIWKTDLPECDQNMGTLMEIIKNLKASENDETMMSAVDCLFAEIEQHDPDNMAVIQYNGFKSAAGKTLKSIISSLFSRLKAMNNRAIIDLMNDDNMEISKLATNEKVAIFCIIPDDNASFNFLVGMLYTQILSELWHYADNELHGPLPRHVTFWLDEFANVAIPRGTSVVDGFPNLVSTCRSRNVSMKIIVQDVSQLQGLFRNEIWKTVIGCCDLKVYLGRSEYSTTEYFSKILGKQTIKYGAPQKHAMNASTMFHLTGRELKTPDELQRMANNECVVMINGLKPVWDKKYDITKHKNFHMTARGGAEPYEFCA